MHALSFWLNILSAILYLASGILLFMYTPKVDSRTIIYNKSERPAIKARDDRKNKMIKLAMFLLIAGFILQMVGMFIDRVLGCSG